MPDMATQYKKCNDLSPVWSQLTAWKPYGRLCHAECLKDIDRFLRRDFDDDRQALLLLGKCEVVTNNLIPLLKAYPEDPEVVYLTRALPNAVHPVQLPVAVRRQAETGSSPDTRVQ